MTIRTNIVLTYGERPLTYLGGIYLNESRTYGKVKQGKIEFNSHYEFDKIIRRYEGQDIEVVVRPLEKKKTSSQDAYYRGVVLKMLSDHTGYTRKEMHDVCKSMCGIESTTNLSRREYSEYIAATIRWAASFHDLYIPNASLPSE